MPDPEPPRLNAQGQEIWFKEADGESGYWPVHRKGWMVFLRLFAWIMLCGVLSMALISVSFFANSPILGLVAVIAPFFLAAPVAWRHAKIVRRHS